MVQDLLEGDGADSATFDTPLFLLVVGAVIVVVGLVLLGFWQLSRQAPESNSSQQPDEVSV